MSRKKPNRHPLMRFAFVVYMAMMLWLLFGRSRGWEEGMAYEDILRQNVNFKPLYTIKNYWKVITQLTNYEV